MIKTCPFCDSVFDTNASRQRGRSRMKFCSEACKRKHHTHQRWLRAPQISLSIGTYRRIREEAAARGVPMSRIVEDALEPLLRPEVRR